MIDIAFLLRQEYPGIDLLNEVRLEDDGSGVRIVSWNRTEPQPNLKALEAKWNQIAYDAYRNRIKRKSAYPEIGDQLDALLKQLNYLRLTSQMELVQDLDDIIGQWLQVKEDYPLD